MLLMQNFIYVIIFLTPRTELTLIFSFHLTTYIPHYREDTIIEEIDDSKNKALLFLYRNCKSDFQTFFQSFTEEQISYHKLDKTIKERLLPEFVNVLKTHKPNASSLGLRVRDLINADLSHCASMVENNGFQPYYMQLNSASSTYILELEKIQQSLF